MEHEFASIEEGVEFISDRIRSMKSIPKDMREELLAQAVALSDPEPRYALPDFSSSRNTSFIVHSPSHNLHWVVKDDSLKLVETIAPSAVAIVSYSVAPAGILAANPIVLATGLLVIASVLFFRAMKKGVFLSSEDCEVVMALKHMGPSSIEAITDRLNGVHIYGSRMWTPEKTEEALRKLGEIAVEDGSVERLVAKASNGLWSVSGL